MSKKTKKILKIVGTVVAVWLLISFVNVLVYNKVITSSKSNANEWNQDEEPPQLENGLGGGGAGSGLGGGSTSSSWYWAGPLCWINTDICW